MSNDGQPLGAPTANPTSHGTRSPEFEDVDLYAPSAAEVASIATSRDSLSNTTFLNTQVNAQSAQRPSITEHQEPIKSILNSENANDVPFVRTPSPISLPSLDVGPLQLSHNGAANTDIGSRRDSESATGNDLSSRRDSSTRQNSDLRQDSSARQDSNSTNKDFDARRSSYSGRNSDIGRDQTSRRGSDARQNSDRRRYSDPPESVHASSGIPGHLRDEQKSTYNGSPLNPANSHEEFRRSSRHRSSRRLPSPPINNPVISANPYSGMGAYATPQLYASPLPIPQYMIPPPVDYTHIYSPNVRPNSHLPPDSMIPSAASPMYPSPHPITPFIQPAVPTPSSRSTRPSVSSNIVTAAALTPELKNMKSIINSIALPDTGSFADNNPYHLRSRQDRSTPDLQSPYSIPGPMPLPPGFQPMPGRQYSYPYYPDDPAVGRTPSVALSHLPLPNVTQSMPNGIQQPNSPWARSAASATPYRHESYDSRRPSRSRSRFDEPLQQSGVYDYYPQRQKTAADIVIEASNTPIPEKKRTQSFTENEPYGGSASRRDTVSPIPERKATGSFAEHNPYRLPSRKPTLDAPTSPLPPRPPSWYRPRPSRGRSPSSDIEYDYDGPDHSGRRSRRRDEWDSEKYRPSRSYRRSPSPHRRSPSPDRYYRSSRSRQRRRSYSPFKYGIPSTPVYQTMPYGTPPSSFDAVPLDMKRHRSNHRRQGFWYQFFNFFKSPFERGRPTTFRAPYPRTPEEPVTLVFIITVIVGQVYFHLLLRLPSLYFSRVSRIFDETNLNIREITEMVFETAGGTDRKDKPQVTMNMQVSELVAPKIRPQYERLKNSWESFIDSLIREWETFNIVSVMLLTAILTILQISTAASDPVTRYAALFSLICSLVSLLFGCMYIIRFGTMRKTYAAAEWAKSVLGSSQSVVWNVWVLLSMPAVWLTWSIILFIVAIMSFVWRTNPANDSVSTFILSSTGLLVIRIAMSAVLGLGLVNAVLITNTFRLYGEVLDKDWRMWINEWKKAKAIEEPLDLLASGNVPPGYMPYLNYGQPYMTPLPTPGSLPPPPQFPPVIPPVIPLAPNFAPMYADPVSQRAARRRRRRSARYAGSAHSESESSSTTSSSEGRSQRRRVRRRPSSPPTVPPYIRPSSRDPPNRNNVYSQTPRISEHDLPPHVVSPIPRRPSRSNPTHTDTTDTQNSNGNPDANAPYFNSPYIPPLQTPPLDSDTGDDPDPQSRVRFRSPLASARGSSDWGAYDSSFDYPSPNIIGPSSSSASGITQESSNLQMQNTDALRRRRPT